MYMYFCIIIILFTQFSVSQTALCRQTNDHKNYTCSGFKFKELSASPNTRREIILARISDCKETSIQENEKGLIFPNLQILKISCGVLKEISENAFTNLNHIVELDLGNNSLSSLPKNMFKPLNELVILDLSFNKFEELTDQMFINGPTNIRKLDFSYNNIVVLMPKTFNKLSTLEELYLNNNAIEPLTTGIFDRIPRILRIDLSYNNIKHLNNAFSNSRNLKYLNISHNSITDLPSRVFYNTHLEVIDLSDNEIEVVYEDIFKWTFLQELYLQNNKISLFEVSGKGISTTPLKHLELRNNRLVYLEDGFIKKAVALSTLIADRNPWDCTCYNKMKALRTSLGLQMSTEHLTGMESVCIIGENKNCSIDRSTIASYYKIFLRQMDE